MFLDTARNTPKPFVAVENPTFDGLFNLLRKKNLMETSTSTDQAAPAQLLDDLLWAFASNYCVGGDCDVAALEEMIDEYTNDPKHYSDGSEVGGWNLGGRRMNVEFYESYPPPHRRSPASPSDKRDAAVCALTNLIIRQGAIKFAALTMHLEELGIGTAGDEELTDEHVMQPHVRAGTTLQSEVSREYVKIVAALFSTGKVMLEIGDPASFASHENPWWVAWVGNRVDSCDAGW